MQNPPWPCPHAGWWGQQKTNIKESLASSNRKPSKYSQRSRTRHHPGSDSLTPLLPPFPLSAALPLPWESSMEGRSVLSHVSLLSSVSCCPSYRTPPHRSSFRLQLPPHSSAPPSCPSPDPWAPGCSHPAQPSPTPGFRLLPRDSSGASS